MNDKEPEGRWYQTEEKNEVKGKKKPRTFLAKEEKERKGNSNCHRHLRTPKKSSLSTANKNPHTQVNWPKRFPLGPLKSKRRRREEPKKAEADS